MLALNDDEELGYPGDEFKIEERMLLSNESTASIRYIKRITDPAKFDALFARALSYQLAAVMAYPITGSTTVSASMLALVDGVLREARTIDGQEGSPDKQDVNILGDVR